MMTLGQNLIKARVDKRLKQKDLQDLVGLSQRYLSAVENSHVDPRLSTVLRLAEALGVSAMVLLDGVTAEAMLLALASHKEERI